MTKLKGIYLKSDNVGSDSNKIQKNGKDKKSYQCKSKAWEHFWSDCMTALGLETTRIYRIWRNYSDKIEKMGLLRKP